MTGTKPDTSKIEGYIRKIEADHTATHALIWERPGQYTVTDVVDAATNVGIPAAKARRLGDLFQDEAKTIRDAEFAIIDALNRQKAAMKKILDEVAG